MHDSHAKTEARVRTRPGNAAPPRVWASREPCEVSVFASGDQVAVQDGLAGAYVPIDPGHRGDRPGRRPGSEFRGKYRQNGQGRGSRH